jgi:glucose-1-phosphate adenylyltransferase
MQEKIEDQVTCIILAGGQGTRLFPLTQTRCKPAVGFGGKFKLIDIPVSNALNSGMSNLFVISQYFVPHLQDHLTSTYHFDIFRKSQIKILAPEEHPLSRVCFEGSGDAVRKNLEELLKTPSSHFLILCGDQVYNIDFRQLLHCAQETDADLVIASIIVEEQEAKRMGVLKVDKTRTITDFFEKPKDPDILANFILPSAKFLGSMGIYIFKREALISLLQEKGDDFGLHLIPLQIKKGKTFAYIYDGYWVDIGTIASFHQANLALLKRSSCLDMYDEDHPIYTRYQKLPSPFIKNTHIEDSLISEGSIIEGSEIHTSIIGVRSVIKPGTKIYDSILIGNPSYSLPPPHKKFAIGENCLIKNTIIDEHVCIGNNVQLINKKKLKQFDGHGIYIRDGIIIVGAGADIPDNFEL